MRVLVAGAAGQLGVDLVRHCESSGDDVISADRTVLDVTDRAAVHGAVSMLRPDIVINAAAWTAVDACEGDADRAYLVNALGPRWFREACTASGAHFVQVSTDYVFDGELDRPYREDDEPNPRSVYGRSKLAGERAATDVLGDGVTIVRTSWVCGEHGANMVKTVRRLAEAGTSMTFVDDQRGRPTFTADLAPALRTVGRERPGGILHLANRGAVSWYGFVRAILEASGFDPDLVSPITTDQLDPPRPAPRPANSVLDDARWVELGHDPLRDFHAPLADLVARL